MHSYATLRWFDILETKTRELHIVAKITTVQVSRLWDSFFACRWSFSRSGGPHPVLYTQLYRKHTMSRMRYFANNDAGDWITCTRFPEAPQRPKPPARRPRLRHRSRAHAACFRSDRLAAAPRRRSTATSSPRPTARSKKLRPSASSRPHGTQPASATVTGEIAHQQVKRTREALCLAEQRANGAGRCRNTAGATRLGQSDKFG